MKTRKGWPLKSLLLFTLLCSTAVPFPGLCAVAHAGAFGFRDYVFGMTREEVSKKWVPGGSCSVDYCGAVIEIKGIDVNFIAFFENNVLSEIRFGFLPTNYKDLLAALVDKYGPPSEKGKTPIQTRMGVRLVNDTAFWKLPDGEVTLSRYGNTIDEGIIIMVGSSYLKKEDKKAKKKETMPGF